ncbi:hypothetical protein HBH70_138910 [Parastagonospora nodorum]|nr:hypothetical protein HBH53_116870 [Parastagonospora nodorum]KAH3971511.1 hypothetical protein HBH52_155610 [Parastagonospora nodorum]KAH4093009.1 hypothetical protein HBH48_075740 [Parastagonospora nodorum]KAH4189676.1 hypothetical protein HBH42_134370 [Parastagonospora nodorum]KAH4326128.1 hypothetical protein HBI00_141760 [Parastagonospora nodorum]
MAFTHQIEDCTNTPRSLRTAADHATFGKTQLAQLMPLLENQCAHHSTAGPHLRRKATWMPGAIHRALLSQLKRGDTVTARLVIAAPSSIVDDELVVIQACDVTAEEEAEGGVNGSVTPLVTANVGVAMTRSACAAQCLCTSIDG